MALSCPAEIVDTKVDTTFWPPHKYYMLRRHSKCPIPVSSFFSINQQSCGLKSQNRMVADFLLSFCGLFGLNFRLKNLNKRLSSGHESGHENGHIKKSPEQRICSGDFHALGCDLVRPYKYYIIYSLMMLPICTYLQSCNSSTSS